MWGKNGEGYPAELLMFEGVVSRLVLTVIADVVFARASKRPTWTAMAVEASTHRAVAEPSSVQVPVPDPVRTSSRSHDRGERVCF